MMMKLTIKNRLVMFPTPILIMFSEKLPLLSGIFFVPKQIMEREGERKTKTEIDREVYAEKAMKSTHFTSFRHEQKEVVTLPI